MVTLFSPICIYFLKVSSAYALVIATGGLVGYFKAGSVPSLVAGLVFGSILGVGAYLTSVNPSHYHLTLGKFKTPMNLTMINWFSNLIFNQIVIFIFVFVTSFLMKKKWQNINCHK